MANLDLDPLVFSTAALIALFFCAKCMFGGNPGSKEGGWIEMVLKVADDLGGGDGWGFVDC